MNSEVILVKEVPKSLDQHNLKEMNASLRPFFDSGGITRWKGRLMNYEFSYDANVLLFFLPVIVQP